MTDTKKDEKQIIDIVNQILTQTTQMDKAINKIEQQIDTLPKK